MSLRNANIQEVPFSQLPDGLSISEENGSLLPERRQMMPSRTELMPSPSSVLYVHVDPPIGANRAQARPRRVGTNTGHTGFHRRSAA